MTSRRAIIAIIAGSFVVLTGVAVSVFVFTRDDAVAADGNRIAFSCKEQHNTWYAICISNTDGTNRQRITKQIQTSAPSWSPDGQEIAFTRNEDVGEYTTYSADDLFVMNADGSNMRQLTRDRNGRHAGQPAWSPDGRQIAYIDGESVPSGQPSRPGGLFVMDADGDNVRRLTRGNVDTDPAWSPGGNEIAFARCECPNTNSLHLDLYVVNVASGATRRLTRTPGVFEATPSWSPDGSRIAFVRWDLLALVATGTAGMYMMNSDGTGEKLVHKYKHFVGGLYSLSWSPDGRTLAFENSPNRECTAIALLDIASGAVRPLTSCEHERESTRSPAWQPNPDDR
jgi:Tol biopolymer transport system component